MKNRQTEMLIHLIKRKIESYKDFCVSPGVYEINELGVPNKATIVFRAITSLGFPSNEMIVPLKVLEVNQSKMMVITFVNNFVFKPPRIFWVKKYGTMYSLVKREKIKVGKTLVNMNCSISGNSFQLWIPWVIQVFTVERIEAAYSVSDLILGRDFLESIFIHDMAQSYGISASKYELYPLGLQSWLKNTTAVGLEEKNLEHDLRISNRREYGQ